MNDSDKKPAETASQRTQFLGWDADNESGSYQLRDGTQVELGADWYNFALVLDDILNKWLYVNTSRIVDASRPRNHSPHGYKRRR